MTKTYVKFEVPKEIKGKRAQAEYLQTAEQILKEQTVLRLYQEKKLSTGTGAKVLGMPLHDFIKFLGRHHVSIFADETETAVQAERETARKAAQNITKRRTRRQKQQ
jgi:predicted HTH domain antitoxin